MRRSGPISPTGRAALARLTNRRLLPIPLRLLLDLNHIFFFIALATPVILLWRLRRLGRARPGGWVAAAVIVLVGTGSHICWHRRSPVSSGGVLWAALLLLPSLAERKIASLLVEKRYLAARRLVFVRRILHPWNDAAPLPLLLRVLELARGGKRRLALDLLATTRTPATTAYTYALTENWSGLATGVVATSR